MASQNIQDLLRFLSQDAKLPLATAIGKVKELQNASLMTPETLAKSDLQTVQSIFEDDKTAKQVHNAAKRVTKKRTASKSGVAESPSKRGKKGASTTEGLQDQDDLEQTLAIPVSERSSQELETVELFTNRAPLVLAFCLVLLKYAMPSQPLTSRLSLAHAYVSISSRGRAVDLGIEKGASAHDEGWGSGQPTVKIMGKDIRVMRRAGGEERKWGTAEGDMPSQGTLDGENDERPDEEPALWGLDLEALKNTNLSNAKAGDTSHSMPIYTPQSARSYLLKAAGTVPAEDDETAKKQSAAARSQEIEANLGLLLRAIELVYESWLPEIGTNGLDRRAWGWYAQVRPDIASGKAGWGAKNVVKLKDILALRKQT